MAKGDKDTFKGDTSPATADEVKENAVVEAGEVGEAGGSSDVATANDPSDDKVKRELDQVVEKTTALDNQTYDRPNRMQLENGVDYDAASDTGPARQGNAYGVSIDALLNFKREAEAGIRGYNRQIERLEDHINELNDKLREAGYEEDSTVNENIADQEIDEKKQESETGKENKEPVGTK